MGRWSEHSRGRQERRGWYEARPVSGSSHLHDFLGRRYDELASLLHSNGFIEAENTSPKYPNEFQEEPLPGLVRIKGVWLPRADEEEDADELYDVTFSMTELWDFEAGPFSQVEREGLWLVGYGYNGWIAGEPSDSGRRNFRRDFDPDKPADEIIHRHPFGQPNHKRTPEDHLDPQQAMESFLEVVRDEVGAGRLELP